MSCVLCLKAKGCLPSYIQLSSDEAIDWDVKNILMQHFWLLPGEDGIVCGECWSYLSEFHNFYIRVQQAYREAHILEHSTLHEGVKVEEKNESLRTSVELKYDDSSENSTDNYDIKEHVFSQHTFSTEELKMEETNGLIESFDLKDPIGSAYENAVPEQKHTQRVARCKKENGNKKNDETLGWKKKRGRPPKSSDLKTKNVHDQYSADEEKVTKKPKSSDLKTKNVHDQDSADEEKVTKKRNKIDEPKKALSRRDLTKYDDFISENVKLTCDICEDDCQNFRKLQIHFRKKHTMRGYVKCCGLKLLKRGVLLDHLQTHKDPEYFKCTKCGKVLANRRCLELHSKNHQEKGEPKFKCEICSKAFHLRRVCKLHMERHVPEELRKLQCDYCPKRYSSDYLLSNHIKRLHLNKYTRICDICGKKIVGSEAFRVHQDQHQGMRPKPFNCDLCGASVKTKYHLARHKKEKHTEEFQTPKSCQYCEKISPNLMALKRHVQFAHRLQRTHQCSMCEKAFKRAVDLKEHFTTHSNDNCGGLYTCTYCPRTFNSSANMYNHRKKMHPEEWARDRKGNGSKLNAETNVQAELIALLE